MNRNEVRDTIRSVGNEVRDTIRSVVELARSTEISFLAGSVAFFAFVSIIPTMLLILAIGSAVGGEAFATRLSSLVETYLSEEGNAVLEEGLENPSGRIGASVLGAIGLLWSALKVFRAVDIAFDRVYRAEATDSLPRQLLNAFVVLVTIGAGLALIVAVQVILTRLDAATAPYMSMVGSLLLLAGLFVVFVPLYHVLPPVDLSVRDTIPGTLTAVLGIVALQQVFSIFASQASQYQAYGFIGIVLLFLLWLYFGSMVLLSGAVVNAAVASRISSRDADTPERAVPQGESGGQDRERLTREEWEQITGQPPTSSADDTPDEDGEEPTRRVE